MGQNLYWQKVTPRNAEDLSCALKWAIEKKYGYGPVILNVADIPFLEGVKAAQFRETDEAAVDCQTLIDAIRENEPGIRLWIE